jgi:HK97 family phage major capsid protein
MKTSVALREERAGLTKEARVIIDRAAKEERDLTPEESEGVDKLMEAVDKLKAQIDRLEKLETAEDEDEAPVERAGRPVAESRGKGHEGDLSAKAKAEFRSWLKTGSVGPSMRADQSRLAEYRDTIIGTDAKGGYLITPTKISEEIVRLTDDLVFMRKLARIMTVTDAKSLGVRNLPTRMADANWTTEVGSVTEDTTMAFSRRDLTPNLLSKLSKISIRALMLSADAEKIVNEELAYKFGITQEKGFLTGSGSSQPLGVFTADATGVTTARDVSTGNTATAFTADGLINAKYSIKQTYLAGPKVGWIFHRDAVKMARKLKVSTSGGNDLEYVWQPGLTEGSPDRILNIPYYISEYAPNTFTTGLYVGLLGNFDYYWIAQVADVILQRLVELYAATSEVGFIGRIWVDGAPIIAEAFARVKLA